MLFRNFTPFPPMQFESRDEKRRDFGVVVLRGSFAIEPGQRLRLVQEQAPVLMADEYVGEPGQSSLHFESNLAPYKPRTDIHLVADAIAPGGRPALQWPVSVQIGELRKDLLVTGPRVWKSSTLLGWRLSEATPVTKVPIVYELAYGGRRGEGEDEEVCETNPVGVGFVDPRRVGSGMDIPAPQILPAGASKLVLGIPIATEGLGPIAPPWSPRREKAGTFNAVWEKTRWPDLPEDFSFDFYNSAAPGLVYPGFVKGDESVTLTHLSSDSPLQFSLPKFQLALLLRFQDGRIIPSPVVLDTIHIEMPERRVYLTWRGVFPIADPLRVLEVRMQGPADVVRPNSKTEPAHVEQVG